MITEFGESASFFFLFLKNRMSRDGDHHVLDLGP